MTEKVEPILFREIKPGERFKLHKDEEGLKLGTLVKSGPQWFTAMHNECRIKGNTRSEAGIILKVGDDFPVERVA
jgi:hypothetical protein